MSQNISDALISIDRNINRLIKIALSFYRRREFAASVHHSIICSEECSKYILLYCKMHLPEDAYRRRFQHAHKTKTLSSFWFIYGSISASFLTQQALRTIRTEDTGSSHDTLIKHIASFSGWNSPSDMANAVMSVLEKKNDPTFEAEREKSHLLREHLRLSSIYVDIDDAGTIISEPNKIAKEPAKKHIIDVLIALAVIKYVNQNNWDPAVFVKMLPRSERIKTEKSTTEHVAAFKARLTTVPSAS